MPRIYSGHPIPALRPEQSDHVPWADCPQGLSSSTGCPVSHSSLPVALLASHPPCGSLWAAPKAPLGPRFPSGQFAALTRREKALYCPFLKEGVRNVARSTLGLPTWTFVRARAHSNPLSKRARLFPSAAYRRSAPPQLALGRLSQRELGYYVAAWVVSPHRNTDLIFSHYGWHYAYSISAAWDASPRLGYFCNAKGQREIQITLAFLASHEARRRMAVFTD